MVKAPDIPERERESEHDVTGPPRTNYLLHKDNHATPTQSAITTCRTMTAHPIHKNTFSTDLVGSFKDLYYKQNTRVHSSLVVSLTII